MATSRSLVTANTSHTADCQHTTQLTANTVRTRSSQAAHAGGLDFSTGVTSTQLRTYESFLVRVARSDFSASGTYHSAGLSSTLAFALPDGRYTSAVFDGSEVMIQANDYTTSSGLQCAKTYVATAQIYPSRSGAATASSCPQSADTQSWWRAAPASSSNLVQWSSVGKQCARVCCAKLLGIQAAVAVQQATHRMHTSGSLG